MNNNFLVFLFLSFMLGCTSSSLSDGTYCADVDRYNPKTQKESAYTLTVEVKNNTIIQMNYSNGGHTDSNDFNPPTIENKSTSFSDKKGVQFSVNLLKKGTDCFGGEEVTRCTGLKKDGTRCNNKTGKNSGRCWKHD